MRVFDTVLGAIAHCSSGRGKEVDPLESSRYGEV